MKHFIPILTFLFITITSFSLYHYKGFTDVWWHRWFLLCIFCTIVIAYKIYKRYHLMLGLIFLHVVFSGLMIFSNYDNIYQAFFEINKIKFFSAYGTFTFVILTIAFLNLTSHLHIIRKTLIGVTFINICYVLYRLFTNQYPLGLWGEPSINGSLIACIVPLILHDLKRFKIFCIWFTVIVALTLASTKASVPVGTISIALSVYFFFTLKNKYQRIALPLGLVLIIFCVASKRDIGLFNDSKRFPFYKIVYTVFNKNVNYNKRYIGWGTGVTQPINQMIQYKNKFRPKEIYMWTHSDWLQILFENGFIGFILAIWLSISLVYKTMYHKRFDLLASILGYMAAMVFSYHLHFAIHAFFAFYLVAEIFRKNEKCCYDY